MTEKGIGSIKFPGRELSDPHQRQGGRVVGREEAAPGRPRIGCRTCPRVWEWMTQSNDSSSGAVLNPYAPYPYTYWGQFTTDCLQPRVRDLVGSWRFTRPTSAHPAGCLVSLADGSVRNVNYSVTPRTWLGAITPDDGKPLGPDW